MLGVLNRWICSALIAFLAVSGLSCSLPAISENAQTETAKSQSQQPPADRFEADICAFEKQDKLHHPNTGCTVFVGSSTFTLWKNLEKNFREFHAVNRGFGGSTFPDINHYVSRIVTSYKPARIVVYAGTNDIAELHHSGAEVAEDFKKFIEQVHSVLPKAEIYFVSMSMAPCRKEFAVEYEKGNSQVQDYIKNLQNVHYVNVLPVMRTKTGELRADLFGPDNLHMNPGGYNLWTPVIKKALRENNH